MAYFHGVRITESPTPLQIPVAVDSALAVAVGVAPVHRLENPEIAVNNPALISSFAEGVSDMGYMDWPHWKAFGLSEMLFSHMRLHRVSPLVLINVWNPLADAVDVSEIDAPVINGVATIADPMAMISSVVVYRDGDVTCHRDTDYKLSYDGDNLLVTIIEGGGIPPGTLTLTVNYKQATVANITGADIAGGVDPATNAKRGLALVDEVFQRFRRIPGFILSPGYSQIPEVAALMMAKAEHLEGDFSCIALIDAPTTGQYADYRNVIKWKNDNGINSPFAFLDWPCVALGDQVFHPSVRIAGMHGQVDNGNGGLPFEQASNKTLSMTRLCDEAGNTIPMLSWTESNVLKGGGIGTFVNMDGWRATGIQTTAFPANGDVKDNERGIRRMFSFVQNVVNRTMWQNVDRPVTRLLIDRILLTGNEYLNMLRSRNAILGGRVEFLQDDNPNISLISGKLFFRVFLTPPGAAREIEFNFSYDPSYLDTLFG